MSADDPHAAQPPHPSPSPDPGVPVPGKSLLPPGLGRWLDRLFTVGVVVLLVSVGYKYLAPRPSAPLEGLGGVQLPVSGQVTLFELGQTHCPACVASQPILAALRAAYGERVRIRVLNMDAGPERDEARQLAELARVRVTPTFLVTDRAGRVTGRFLGPTSYLALAGALDQALARP